MSIFRNTIILLTFFISGSSLIGQESNVFLERGFWEKNTNLQLVKEKIKQGNDPAETTSHAFDAVVYALLAGTDAEVINYLLSQEGNEIEKKTHDSRTYIFWAAYAGNIKIMDKLLSEGARLDITDSHGQTPVTFAAGGGKTDKEIYETFEKYGVDISKEENEHGANVLLLISPHINDFSELEYFTSKGLNLNSTDNDGNGIFNYAAKNGNIDFLQQLVDNSVDYKKKNNEGGNAFLFAARGGRGHSNSIAVYQYLKSLGLDPNVVTHSGYTPFHSIAYSEKDKNIINFFLENGAKLNQKDAEGNTPFMNAASRNSLEIVRLLEKKVDNINEKNKKEQTALMLAIANNDIEVAKYLLENGANAAATDKQGKNLAYYLLDSYKLQGDFRTKLDLLMKNGVEMTKTQADGNSLYHLAVQSDEVELVKILSTFNLDVNAKNSEGHTPLHIAAMKAKDDEILKYLIAQGAKPSIKTEFDETVYDIASENELLKTNQVNLNFLK